MQIEDITIRHYNLIKDNLIIHTFKKVWMLFFAEKLELGFIKFPAASN